jgi:hypothetical protein
MFRKYLEITVNSIRIDGLPGMLDQIDVILPEKKKNKHKKGKRDKEK